MMICLVGLSTLMYSLKSNSMMLGLTFVASCSGFEDNSSGGSSSFGPPIGELCLAQETISMVMARPITERRYFIFSSLRKVDLNSYLYYFFHLDLIYSH